MQSPARLVIFPLQDILGLGDEARMNKPGVSRGNWEWRVSEKQMKGAPARRLAEMVEQYGRQL